MPFLLGACMPYESRWEEFLERAVVGSPVREARPDLYQVLVDVAEEALRHHVDIDWDFSRALDENLFGTIESSLEEGDLPRWFLRALIKTRRVPIPEKRPLVQRLVPWVKLHGGYSRHPPCYYLAVDFLLGQREPFAQWFPYLLLPSDPRDVRLASGMVERAVSDPSIPALWAGFLLLRLPVVFHDAHGPQRIPTLRQCAEVFFSSPLDDGIKEILRHTIHRGRRAPREGTAFPVPEEFIRFIPAFDQMERTMAEGGSSSGTEVFVHFAIADERLYPTREMWLPYAQALSGLNMRGPDSPSLARRIRTVTDARDLNAMLAGIQESGKPLEAEVEAALRMRSQDALSAFRSAAFDILLAFGSNPIADAERAVRDPAGTVRSAPQRVAISQIKMACLSYERRRILVTWVHRHKEQFDWSPKQAASLARAIQLVGLATDAEIQPNPGGTPTKVEGTDGRPLQDPSENDRPKETGPEM